jgi:hypothetical protein
MINNKLKELYSRNWEALTFELNNNDFEDDPARPYLIKIREEAYFNADIRIMFVGKETNGWHTETSQLEEVLENYYDFIFNEKCWKYGGQYWNGVSSFIENICGRYPQKKISSIFNNVIKIGKSDDKGRPSDDIMALENKYLNVLQEEINILNPSLIVFLSGYDYDDIIESKLEIKDKYSIDGFKMKELVEMKLEGTPYVFRTYHPNFLFRNNIHRYYDAILNRVDFTDFVNTANLNNNDLSVE